LQGKFCAEKKVMYTRKTGVSYKRQHSYLSINFEIRVRKRDNGMTDVQVSVLTHVLKHITKELYYVGL